MANNYSHQFITGISFGLTTSVITSLGMIAGLYAATSSRLAVVAGVVIMAIADGLSDAVSLHTVEEAEMENGKTKHTSKEIWLTTLFTFLAAAGFTFSFVVPILMLQLKIAVAVDIIWGALLLTILNFFIAKSKKEKPLKLILEHLFLAGIVIVASHLLGDLMQRLVK